MIQEINDIIVLKISLEDLKSENFDNIIELGRVEYGEWDTLSSLVPNGEVDGIKKEFEEDLAMLQEDDYEDAEVDSACLGASLVVVDLATTGGV